MGKLVELTMEDGSKIYIEAGDDSSGSSRATRSTRQDSGKDSKISAKMDTMENTLRHFTRRALAPFKEVAEANIDKVKLEFGITLSAEGGVPFITKGGMDTTLKVTVECSFPEKKTA